ncbi:MAG: PhoH family protein [Deltaproteobacteria bacterium]|nr:PhoH family protein [Deltaproteobacteria bacterium]
MSEPTSPADPQDALAARDQIAFDDNAALLELSGANGEHLKALERELAVQIHVRGNELTVVGAPEAVEQTSSLLGQLYALAKKGRALGREQLLQAVRVLKADGRVNVKAIFTDTVLATSMANVLPKSLAQKEYVDAMRSHDIVFGIGPAGTGKTYLAMAMAVGALQRRAVKRIILTRPAVEAGEKLGFLPGDLAEKVNPYLRPLYDALHDMMELDRAEQLIARGQIEVAPLAFMRGRTLNGSFVVLDEAQNTTGDQMLMFLTRLGFDSKAVVTGDVTQVDLPPGAQSGLSEAQRLLAGVEGIAFCRFTERDVVRHPLVQKIIKAYEGRGRAGSDEPTRL